MNKGFGLIEVIVSIAIVAILCISFTALTLQALKVSRINANELKARMYVQELIEVAKDLEQSDWAEFSECTVCHPLIDGGKWKLSVGPENIDIYTRSLLIEDVDPNKRKITASIGWLDKGLTIESYVYNYTEE